MSDSAKSPPPLLTELAADPELAELVREFVASLPERIAALEQALAVGDLARTAMLAHQLKGAAGGYGFRPISQAAHEVETKARSGHDAESVRTLAGELASLCRRAQGPP